MPVTKFRLLVVCLSTAALLLLCASHAAAQSAQIDSGDRANGTTTRYSGGVLTIEVRSEVAGGGWAGTYTARVADLDVEKAQVEGTSIDLECKGGANCVSSRGHWVGLQLEGNGSPDGDGPAIGISCSTQSECDNFLSVLKVSVKPPAPPGQPARTVQSQPLANPPESPSANVAPRPSATPAAAPTKAQTPFQDVADEVRRAGDTKTLDDLAKKTKPTPKPQRPPAEQPTYVAFAQSAGFDANGGYGYAVGRNLNDAIGQANTNCANNAKTSCGDEGYCMLRPGLWGAWASDLKYLGAKAFACNLKTKEEAENQAKGWCSNECSVIWSGAGQ